MTISIEHLEKIARLAYLNVEPNASQLAQDINDIMDFVNALQSVDTAKVTPLFHPLNQFQRLREDTVTEAQCLAELEAIAPLFEDNVYLVPKVINTEKA